MTRKQMLEICSMAEKSVLVALVALLVGSVAVGVASASTATGVATFALSFAANKFIEAIVASALLIREKAED